MNDLVFEKMFNDFLKNKENQYLSDKSTAYYFYIKSKEYYKRYDN